MWILLCLLATSYAVKVELLEVKRNITADK